MQTQDICLLRGLIDIISRYNNTLSCQDRFLLNGINRIINICVDVNDCWHGDDGKYIRKNGGGVATATDKGDSTQSSYSVYDENGYLKGSENPPIWIEKPSNIELQDLMAAASGLTNAEAGNKRCVEPESVQSSLSNAYLKLCAINRTDAVVQALKYRFLNLNEIEIVTDKIKQYQNAISKVKRELTPKEKEILLYMGAGYRQNEVMALFNKKYRSYISHDWQRALDKLEVNDSTSAVVLALQKGYIDLHQIDEKRLMRVNK